jgi:cytochrome c peroxidase
LFFAPKDRGGAGCAVCHEAPTFALAANSRSNGIGIGETRIFKAPSLKNISATGPYMHDASYATLAEVIEHYNSDVDEGPALDQRLRGPDGLPQRLNLSEVDKAALVDFLKTLQDPVLNTDPRFGNPFKK